MTDNTGHKTRVTITLEQHEISSMLNLTNVSDNLVNIEAALEQACDEREAGSSEEEQTFNTIGEFRDIILPLGQVWRQIHTWWWGRVASVPGKYDCHVELSPQVACVMCYWASVSRTFDAAISELSGQAIQVEARKLHQPLTRLHQAIQQQLWGMVKPHVAKIPRETWFKFTDRQAWKVKRIIEAAVFAGRDTDPVIRELLTKFEADSL